MQVGVVGPGGGILTDNHKGKFIIYLIFPQNPPHPTSLLLPSRAAAATATI